MVYIKEEEKKKKKKKKKQASYEHISAISTFFCVYLISAFGMTFFCFLPFVFLIITSMFVLFFCLSFMVVFSCFCGRSIKIWGQLKDCILCLIVYMYSSCFSFIYLFVCFLFSVSKLKVLSLLYDLLILSISS